MYNKMEIIYIHDKDNIEVIDEFSGNTTLTVDQALELCGVDMDMYAEEKGWDGYDWNSIDIRFKEE